MGGVRDRSISSGQGFEIRSMINRLLLPFRCLWSMTLTPPSIVRIVYPDVEIYFIIGLSSDAATFQKEILIQRHARSQSCCWFSASAEAAPSFICWTQNKCQSSCPKTTPQAVTATSWRKNVIKTRTAPSGNLPFPSHQDTAADCRHWQSRRCRLGSVSRLGSVGVIFLVLQFSHLHIWRNSDVKVVGWWTFLAVCEWCNLA